jgi:hypothetical protein
MLELLREIYLETYYASGNDVALGLTGSKAHAVAMAAFSTVAKIAEAWYVQPRDWDPERFTTGSAETTLLRLSISH